MSQIISAPIQTASEEVPSEEKQRLQMTHVQSQPQPQPQPQAQFRKGKSSRLPDKFTVPLIATALLCVVGCIVTGYYADGRIVAEWIPDHRSAVQPTVLLALFTGIFAFCAKIVFASGVSIVWWRTLKRPGTQLEDLHYIFKRGIGESIKDTWRNALKTKEAKFVLAVFVVITAADISDGPLLQRAIKTGLSNHTTQYESTWGIAPHILDGWVGEIDLTSPASLFGSTALDSTLQDWYLKRTLPAYNCGGICDGPIQTMGIDVNCSSSERTLDLTSPQSVNATLFSLSFNRTQSLNSTPTLEMTHLFMHDVDKDCVGTIGVVLCSIRTAKVTYDLHQDVDQLQLAREHGFPRSLAPFPSSGDLSGPQGGPAGPLAALEYFGYYYLQSNGTHTGFYNDSTGLEPSGGLVQQYLIYDTSNNASNQSCSTRWANATDDILWNLHDIMFRLDFWSTKGNETTQIWTWTRTVEALTYKVEFVSLWVAAGIMLASIMAATSLLYGYWQLNRHVSLSPLETGRALALMIMDEPAGDRDMDVEELLKVMGHKKKVRITTEEYVGRD